jgi:hypothetical protein
VHAAGLLHNEQDNACLTFASTYRRIGKKGNFWMPLRLWKDINVRICGGSL